MVLSKLSEVYSTYCFCFLRCRSPPDSLDDFFYFFSLCTKLTLSLDIQVTTILHLFLLLLYCQFLNTSLTCHNLCLRNMSHFYSGRSDLDRDFWNNNDSSNVQQRWSSYPPKEFLLNMSPYAPYGDPRLTPKWVSVLSGKGHLFLGRAVMNRDLYTQSTETQNRVTGWHYEIRHYIIAR